MRYYPALLAGVCLFLAGCSSPATSPESTTQPAAQSQQTAIAPPPADAKPADPGSPPDTIEFVSKRDGNVIFTHKQHFERVNGDCSVCHDKIFTQSRAPINYGKALHRAAEANRTACASCHAIGGTAFAADSNCSKCHQSRHPH